MFWTKKERMEAVLFSAVSIRFTVAEYRHFPKQEAPFVLTDALLGFQQDYEGAFYGPKLDFRIAVSLGRY